MSEFYGPMDKSARLHVTDTPGSHSVIRVKIALGRQP